MKVLEKEKMEQVFSYVTPFRGILRAYKYNVIKKKVRMKTLTFRYGAMISGKTSNLLSEAKNAEIRGKKVVLMKPFVNNAWSQFIESRTGLKRKVDILIKYDTNLQLFDWSDCPLILVDEAQFLSRKSIEELREISLDEVPIICYGLRNNFKGELFEGAQYLLEKADIIEELPTSCWYCDLKATHVLRLKGGTKEVEVEMPGEMNYAPVCYKCWKERHNENSHKI